MNKIRVGILGAAGFAGGELIRHLLNHALCKITYLESNTALGKMVSDAHKFLKGMLDVEFQELDVGQIAKRCDVVFVAKPHSKASLRVKEIIDQDIKIIDLSADFRLEDVEVYEEWYKTTHSAPELIHQAVYGLPEINYQKIKTAKLVANPGCYPTSIILGLAPLLSQKIISPQKIFIDSYSGVSGAGKTHKPNRKNLFIDASGNIMAYDVGNHPHTPEIEQELSKLAKKSILVSFIPHLAPFDKGIMSTIHVTPIKKIEWDDIIQQYYDYYKSKPFIRIYDKEEYPTIKAVVDTNFCDIGVWLDKRTDTLTIITTIDNSIKGGAGQAIQNMNLMFGLSETEGLPYHKVLNNPLAHKHLSVVHFADKP